MLVRIGPDRSPPCHHSQCIFKEIMIHLFYERKKEAVGDLRTRILHACERRRHGARKAFVFFIFPFFFILVYPVSRQDYVVQFARRI